LNKKLRLTVTVFDGLTAYTALFLIYKKSNKIFVDVLTMVAVVIITIATGRQFNGRRLIICDV